MASIIFFKMLKPSIFNETFRSCILACAIVFAAFIFLSIQSFRNSSLLPRGLFTYDEADYMFAADRGFIANYFDVGAQSIFSYISAGLKGGMEKSRWSHLSKSVRESNDICFYRHFHGPLYFYWLCAAKKLGVATEVNFRYATFITLFMCIAALVLISAKLFPADFMAPSLLMGLVLLLSPSSILTMNHLTPHGLYMVLSLLCLGCAAIFCKISQRRYWYLSVTAASLSFMTLEYTMFLLVALLCTLILKRKSLFQGDERESTDSSQLHLPVFLPRLS